MKNAIIGYGFVGQAIHSVLRNKIETLVLDNDKGFNHSLESILAENPDVIFLCLPTPTVDGMCDDSLIQGYVNKLKDWPGCLIIKSTIPPSSVERVLSVRPTTVVWPELLRESYAERDMKFPSIIVVGAPSKLQFEFVNNFIKQQTEISWNAALSLGQPISKIRFVKPVEASIFKYSVNSFLATKTLFFHQMRRWMDSSGRGESYEEVTKLLQEEGRVGASHMVAPGEHGLGFAGNCFPKDVEALIGQVYHEDRTTFALLNEVSIQNKQLRAVPQPTGSEDSNKSHI